LQFICALRLLIAIATLSLVACDLLVASDFCNNNKRQATELGRKEEARSSMTDDNSILMSDDLH
jgi:hypothetical protein